MMGLWNLRRFFLPKALISRDTMAVDAKVRAALVATLYSSPGSLALGALCGLGACVYIAWASGNHVLTYATVVLTTVVIGRIVSAFAFHNDDAANEAQTRLLELIYEAGAWAYAALLGAIAGLTIVLVADAQLHVLAAANAIGYAGGVSARNAGRPQIAVGQNLLASVPLAIGLAVHGSPPYLLLALCQILFIVAVTGITLRTFSIVHASFVSAHRNALLADEMRTFATTDPVTKLMNRAGLDSWLAEAFAADEPPTLAFFWLDLDRFKEVNDSLGHPVGDEVLREIAARLAGVCDQKIAVARFGGDEFVLVARDMDRAQADSFGRTVLTVLGQQMRVAGHNICITASLGISLCPDDGTKPAAVMRQADMALYASKLTGRGCLSFFDRDMDLKLTHRREIEAELRRAVGAGELRIHYQPVVHLATGRVAAMEALVRWEHPTRGLLYPDAFIPVAESSGAIITIGNWIALEACRAAQHWPDDVKVAINLSPVQMQAPGAALGFLNALKRSGLPAHRLELEITENVFADQSDHMLEFIRLIEAAGVGFVLDDFGAGYSSLSYIRDFSFSKIKIDRAFVSGLADGDRASAVVAAVGGLARQLAIPLVAEGIESAADAERCAKLGCTHGQGFHYSRAVPGADVPALIAAANRQPHAVTPILRAI